MHQEKKIPFRDAHGLLKVDCISKIWNGIDVRYCEKYAGPGRAYADMSSDLNTVAVCLERKGGHCEAQFDLNTATERNRYDAAFAVWVPSNRTVWGFSERAPARVGCAVHF